MSQNKKVVAVINTHKEAELAIATLAENGFDINHLSIVGKGYQTQEHATGFYNTGDRIKSWVNLELSGEGFGVL